MYNRYIPREDGSYARNRMQDKIPHAQHISPPPPEKQPNVVEEPDFSPREEPKKQYQSGGFLKHLLPKGFDTGDLIVILLLLLMAGDCEEDRNNAILTIALYFLM